MSDEQPEEPATTTEEETTDVVDEVKLYVGNLSFDTDENALRAAFEVHGTVTDVFLPSDRMSGRPRGFGFVTFASRSDAETAISKMDQTDLDGRTIKVNESRPKGEGGPRRSSGGGGGGGFNPDGKEEVKLYVGNLSFDTEEQTIRDFFGQYGSVSDCFMPTDRDSGRPRGFAFVTMPAADAQAAIEQANGYELEGRNIRVNESRPKYSGGGGYRNY